MSKSLSPTPSEQHTPAVVDAKLLAALGGTVEASRQPTVETDGFSVAYGIRQIRSKLYRTMASSGVGVRELARRMGVSPAVASRMVNAEGDLHVSTAILWAKKIGKRIEFRLVDEPTVITVSPQISAPVKLEQRPSRVFFQFDSNPPPGSTISPAGNVSKDLAQVFAVHG